MKKKILITLGCSYTEGMGCYDFENFPKESNIFSNGVTKSQVDYQFTQFHLKGWPNKLGKLLGYDSVLNLGYGGASPSFNLKVFMQKYRNTDFSEWEVFVLWWIPQSHRFSFYKNHKAHNILPNPADLNTDNVNLFGKAYLNFVDKYPTDCILETVFYLGLMEDYCKFKSYNFLWFSEEYEHLLKSNHISWIGLTQNELMTIDDIDTNKSCGHPNELGYEKISNRFFEAIKKKEPTLINNNPPDSFHHKWDGKPVKNDILK